MRRLLISTLLLLMALPAFAHGGRHRGMNISISEDDWRDVVDCGQINVRFDGERVAMTTEEIAVGNRGTLRIRSDRNGGIRVTGWDVSGYSVKACKAIGADVNAADVRVTRGSDEISATGPEDGRWVVYFLVRAPSGASLDLISTNGPVGIAGVNGDVKARVTNGPISVKESSGKIDARSTNGPISLQGGSGDVTLEAQNGPVSVKLDGTSWNGSLEASTKNGPVSLKIPRGFRSGVLVEQLGHGPISCRAEDCRKISLYSEDEDDEGRVRRIELGSGPRTVRLSTVNGPVSVKDLE